MQRHKASLGILGLSHIWGETKSPDVMAGFWRNLGFIPEFLERLDVPVEKREFLLHDRDSAAVQLSYLSSVYGFGIEFTTHGTIRQVERGAGSSPLISVIVNNVEKEDRITDPDGNSLISLQGLDKAKMLAVRTRDIQQAASFLEELGFSSTTSAANLGRLFPAALNSGIQLWSLAVPVFPRLQITIALIADTSAPLHPKVDEYGLSGISLVTRSIDEVAKKLPIQARQRCHFGRDRKIEVGFCNQYGLLIEFPQFMK